MEQIDFFRNALANSVELLLNTEAHVRSHLNWIAETKRLAIESKLYGKAFNSDDICNYEDWEQKGIPRDTMMKVVNVEVYESVYDIISALKSRSKSWAGELFSVNVFFMCDPDTLLKSRARLTKEEERVLKEMRKFYISGRDGNARVLDELIRDLRGLKHKYEICFSLTWRYGFADIMKEDFLERGLVVQGAKLYTLVESSASKAWK